MPLYTENYKLNYDEEKSYQDFHQSCPQIEGKKRTHKKLTSEFYFELPVNYCPYLMLELGKLITKKLKTNCYQIEFELFCQYENKYFQFSLSSKKGSLDFETIYFELERYIRQLDLTNPISSVSMSMIESINKFKLINSNSLNQYDVFTSVNYLNTDEDVYLGLVKLDLDTRF